jgi:signal transduction histidine kinase
LPAAETIGADRSLFAVVQLAIGLADRAGYSLCLAPWDNERSLSDGLGLAANDLQIASDRFQSVDFDEAFEPPWSDPRLRLRLPALLQAALVRRRAEVTPYLASLERDLDRLHDMVAHGPASDDGSLRDAKLSALAEFAAGASHEINNPLAVIAGQSQYLLNRQPDECQRKALESIVRQTQRIHGILTDLMQFARPPRINPQRLSLGELVSKAIDPYRGQAADAGVELECRLPDSPDWVDGDVRQLQAALGCLIRNAIEAAPKQGWVRIGMERLNGRVEVRVEDNGPGLTAEQRVHMFDPFYSGRSAGRGRGLGLPTAWRLAREHGGDVQYVPASGGPTRFALILPLADHVERLSA